MFLLKGLIGICVFDFCRKWLNTLGDNAIQGGNRRGSPERSRGAWLNNRGNLNRNSGSRWVSPIVRFEIFHFSFFLSFFLSSTLSKIQLISFLTSLLRILTNFESFFWKKKRDFVIQFLYRTNVLKLKAALWTGIKASIQSWTGRGGKFNRVQFYLIKVKILTGKLRCLWSTISYCYFLYLDHRCVG